MKIQEPVKILLVDDRPENLLALEVMLANKNYELVKTTTGKEALKILLREQDFALILMDALMPIMDGFETATMIRQSAKLKHVPIIFLTAQLNTPDNIFKGYQAGAVDYMLKPLSAEILKAKVAVFVDLYKKNKELIFQIEEKNKAERAALVAEEAAKSKQQFLANMSHEIRTPLNAIIGFTKVILKTELNEKQKEYLNAIKVSGDSLIVLINDILDLAKVDSGKMTFEKTPFKLSTAVSSMLLLFDTKIKENNLQLVKQYDDSIPEVLVGDPVRLQQIILNLLSNAVKFTTKGKITVSVNLMNQDAENAAIEFSVIDTGIGIPENKIGKIFDNFQQATSKTTRLFGGTGLGLAIVKQLVEAQHGTINVKSKVGEGSTFSFILNFKKTDVKIETETDNGVEQKDEIKDVKILVAEDVTLNQLLMKTVVGEFGFEIDIAENGKIAIEKLEKNKYDVVLMDLQMPEMDGFEATEHIRNKMHSQIPIIALTADVTTVDVEKCKSVGMNDYISKPVEEKSLYNKIVKYIRHNTEQKTNGAIKKTKKKNASGTLDMAKQEKKYTNTDFLRQMTRGDSKMMAEMMKVYIEETPKYINKIKQGINNMDWESVARATHSLLPSFSTMGINKEFADMAKKLNEYAEKKENLEKMEELSLKIEQVCSQACEELKQEIILTPTLKGERKPAL